MTPKMTTNPAHAFRESSRYREKAITDVLRAFARQEVSRLEFFIPWWDGKSVKSLFPSWVMSRFPFQDVRYQYCLICHCPLPKGVAPVCSTCLVMLSATTLRYCFISDEMLDDDQTQAQESDPLNLEHKVQPGYCRDYLMLATCVVAGEDMSFLKS